MTMPKRYIPSEREIQIQNDWEKKGLFQFSGEKGKPVYSIDTPPATVSGHLHLGHFYSYSQTDFLARFWRMNGYDVYYPMGFDDNGLPTERLVERTLGVDVRQMKRETFIKHCMEISDEFESEYQRLWRRVGLSIDWRYTYKTIEERSLRISQASFLDLYRKNMVYRDAAPSIWCPECQTALAQADLEDREREKDFYTLAFKLEDGSTLPIATTRPELLPACVAVFIHPSDTARKHLLGKKVYVPLFGQAVKIYEDLGVDQSKGTGVVMCCTFGDSADIQWWRTHDLPLKVILDPNGNLTQEAGPFTGFPVDQAQQEIIQTLEKDGLVLDRMRIQQSVRVHERCDTPVEFLVTKQWFIHLLDNKEAFLRAADEISWHPEHMKMRYIQWVENLHWDWLISRQRYFGVPFPIWYCDQCGEVILAKEDDLPVYPISDQPSEPCHCGGTTFLPEMDVMDTWATSSMTPQIASGWLTNPELYQRTFPMSLRPQAHEIIRTWAFYTIVKSAYHFQTPPWKDVAISGWGLAPTGSGKISKSRGGGPISPDEVFDRYSADAVRYWSGSTGLGKDSVISEDKIKAGSKLVTKLWNVARFSERFLSGDKPAEASGELLPLDKWILSRLQRTINLATAAFENYDYVTALNETETLFWHDLADNYLEMVKYRLYGESGWDQESAKYSLYLVLINILKLFAPVLPHITEEIFQILFAESEKQDSIHSEGWPRDVLFELDEDAESFGEVMVYVVSAVRRYKSEKHLPLSSELGLLQVAIEKPGMTEKLKASEMDLKSATRVNRVEIFEECSLEKGIFVSDERVQVAIFP